MEGEGENWFLTWIDVRQAECCVLLVGSMSQTYCGNALWRCLVRLDVGFVLVIAMALVRPFTGLGSMMMMQS